MKKIAIIGLGLMGGSLGLAVKRKNLAESVLGYARREENRHDALEQGVCDSVFDRPEDAVKDADFVVFCVPVLATLELARICKPHFSSRCIVTDVGSTKTELVAKLGNLFEDTQTTFAGSHPLAGSEKSGLDAAHADLYKNALVVVTAQPDDSASRDQHERNEETTNAVPKVTEFWENLGAKVVVMDPAEHDRIIARTSHLPHLVAAMLVNNLKRDDDHEIERFCGTGFRDTTRIAGGSEDIWHDIVKSNRFSVSNELDQFGQMLARVKAMIDEGDFGGLRRFLAESRRIRRKL